MQNLIIRDRKGIPVAKSSIYVNKNEGYAVFNNVEVAHHMYDYSDEIFKEYMNGVYSFIKAYNEKNSSSPLTRVSVGMNLNDLDKQIQEHCIEHEVLEMINFEKYGNKFINHGGDWYQHGQYLLWCSDDYKIVKPSLKSK